LAQCGSRRVAGDRGLAADVGHATHFAALELRQDLPLFGIQLIVHRDCLL